MNEKTMLGRVLRSSSSTFTFGYNQPDEAPPVFGSLTRAELGEQHVYGLVYDVVIHDDPFVRQIVAVSGTLPETKIQDMRQRRQVPIEVTALAIAQSQQDHIYQRIPPRPPGALQPIFSCSHEVIRLALADFDFFRTVLNNALCPADELLAASLRESARCQLPGQRQDYLLRAGRELARLLAVDLPRLDSILRRITP